MLLRAMQQEASQLALCARQAVSVRELLRARDRGWPDPPPVLAPLEDVNRWMSDPRSVDQDIGVFDRTQIWMNLRLLHGLDLDEFLVGSRHAYHVVSELMHGGKWDAVAPLVGPECLEAMRELAPQIDELPSEALDDEIKIVSAVLRDARVLEPCKTKKIAKGTAHLDVRFSALQGITLHDLQNGHTRMAPRLQESTWTFEGVVRGDGEEGGMAASATEEEGEEVVRDWRVIDIAWQVWEVQKPPADEHGNPPGWPTHGP